MGGGRPAGGRPGGPEGLARPFTMIEIITVLVLVGILGAVVVSGTINRRPVDLVAEAAVLRSHLRFTQSKAMADELNTWEVRLAAGSYTLYRNGAVATMTFPNESSATHALPGEVSLTVAAGGPNVCFDGWGRPTAGTHLISLSQGGESRTITVTANTGYIP